MIPFDGDDASPKKFFFILPEMYDCLPAKTAYLNANAIS